MPRYDKYQPHAGGFRALMGEAIAVEDSFNVVGVGLDSDGHVVLGAGQTGIVGAMVAHGAKRVGDAVDVMTAGEIVEFTADGEEGGADADAGTVYYAANASGVVADSGDVPIGITAEAQRLIVRISVGSTIDVDTQ